MPLSRFLPITAGAALGLVLAGCGADASRDHTAADTGVHGIPKKWLATTSHAWPDSDGFKASTPVLSSGDCATYDGSVTIAGARPAISDVGYGPLGSAATTSAYRYVCEFDDSDHYAGSFQIIKATDRAEAEEVLDNSMDDTDTSVQTNDVTTVTAGGVKVHVLKRWYPTNPQGMYEAVYLDQNRSALAVLEVDSLDKAHFASYTEKDVAADLIAVLGSA